MHVHTNIIRFHRALLRLYLKSYNNSKLLPLGRPFIYSVATWPFRNTQPLLEWYRNGQRCNAWQHHSTTEQEAVATWPFRSTQPLIGRYRNGQVATASCSVVERRIRN